MEPVANVLPKLKAIAAEADKINAAIPRTNDKRTNLISRLMVLEHYRRNISRFHGTETDSPEVNAEIARFTAQTEPINQTQMMLAQDLLDQQQHRMAPTAFVPFSEWEDWEVTVVCLLGLLEAAAAIAALETMSGGAFTAGAVAAFAVETKAAIECVGAIERANERE